MGLFDFYYCSESFYPFRCQELKNFRSQRNDLHMSFVSQFTGYWSKYAGTTRFICIVQ